MDFNNISANFVCLDYNKLKFRVLKKRQAIFLQKYSCTIAYVSRSGCRAEKIEMRFGWDLNEKELKTIYDAIQLSCGDPLWYGNVGYIWRVGDHYVSFGWVEVGCHFDVPMIQIRKIDSFGARIDFATYRDTVNVFYKVNLLDVEISFIWSEIFGFGVFADKGDYNYCVNFKDDMLVIIKSEIILENNAICHKPFNKKQIKVLSLEHMEKILLELVK